MKSLILMEKQEHLQICKIYHNRDKKYSSKYDINSRRTEKDKKKTRIRQE